MSGLATLLRLRLRLVRNTLRSSTTAERVKLGALLAFSGVSMLAEGWAARKVFSELQSHQDLGTSFVLILVERMLALVFLTSLTMLVFSNAITSFSTSSLDKEVGNSILNRIFPLNETG